MIELRRAESEDVDVFLALRRASDSAHMPSRLSYVHEIKRPEHSCDLREGEGLIEPVERLRTMATSA